MERKLIISSIFLFFNKIRHPQNKLLISSTDTVWYVKTQNRLQSNIKYRRILEIIIRIAEQQE